MFKTLLLSAIFSLSLMADSITIAAAANLKYALEEIANEFSKDSKIETKIITGASGKLTQQIISGAPYDLFLSADVDFPQKLYEGGFSSDKPRIYAYGTLVLWSNSGLDLSRGVAILTDSSVKKIAIANPRTAPYGTEAMRVLKHYNLENSVKNKIVTAESISQVANFVTTKSVEAGFMAKSIVLSEQMRGVGSYIEIDSSSYNKIDQAMVIVKKSPNQTDAQKFYDFMSSKKAIDILKKHGYGVNK